MLWYLGKQVFQVFEVIVYIQIICLRCFYDAVYNGTGLSSMDRIDQLPVFLSNTKRPDCLFCQVVIKRYLRIIKEYPQVFFLIDSVFDAICCF